MGTTTFYLKMNDLAPALSSLSKEDLKLVDQLHPFSANRHRGWSVPLELHNGNIYVLVFWKGQLMKLENAPHNLNHKYYDKYKGKILKEYEWTLLRNYLLREVASLDKIFRQSLKKESRFQP